MEPVLNTPSSMACTSSSIAKVVDRMNSKASQNSKQSSVSDSAESGSSKDIQGDKVNFLGTPAKKAIGQCSSEESEERRSAALARLAKITKQRQMDRDDHRRVAQAGGKQKFRSTPAAPSSEVLAENAGILVADLRDSSCIIFDWDDTLFPTWYVDSVVKPCSLEENSSMAPLFLESMASHAALVKKLLQTARKFARVAIVTLAARPWVQTMATKYWLDFSFEELLSELEVPVFYAREYLAKAEIASFKGRQDEGVNLYVVAKRKAMLKCLSKFKKVSGCSANNIISVGDAFMEHEAMKEVVWAMDDHTFCKSVLFVQSPPISTLTKEVETLIGSMGRLVAVQDDFDLDMQNEKDVLRMSRGMRE